MHWTLFKRSHCIKDNRLVANNVHVIHAVYPINFIGVPVSPQGLLSRVLESGSDYLVIEVTWDTPDPDLDSRTDFYHYKVLDGLQEENASVVLDFNTTNTTVIIDLNGLNTALFVLSAWNCEGASTPAAIVIHNGENEILL